MTLMMGIALIIPLLGTCLGSAMVFLLRKEINEKLKKILLGFASGVMIAASIWSLLLPALEMSTGYGRFKFLPALVGFLSGGLFLVLIDKLIPHIHKGSGAEEGMKNHLNKSTKLFLAVTIHNIPEGLAVGFAFGAAAVIGTQAAFLSALGLAIGIGIQNFPEGTTVALPMCSEGKSVHKAFLFGAMSGAVEPLFAVIGYFLASTISAIQPWLLSFAAGAMIFVVAEDLIPDAKIESHPHLGTWGVMIGFALMMVLDVAFG